MNRIRNIVVSLFILPIHGYRMCVSKFLPPSCRFYPSCSAYSIQALKTHGLPNGLILSIRRITKCHPWSRGGIDEVPLPRHTNSPQY